MLTELALRDFRCFSQCRVALHPEMTLLVGRNAQGKTSLMEAACVLLRLQSPRTSDRTELIRMGAGSLLIEGVLKDGTKLRYAQTPTARRLAVNGATCGRATDYLAGGGLVVWMDHRDMNLLRGSPEHRRRFLDFAASQINPDYLRALRNYERALRGRNHVLKRDAAIQWRQADAFAAVMEENARILVLQRGEWVEALKPHVKWVHGELSGGAESVDLTYLPGMAGASLVEQLRESREEESRLRVTAAGPHRDDLGLELNSVDATAFASEGQQRSLALALKIGQALALDAAAGKPPLLMLDDVFGELDSTRREALLRLLPAGTQKIITTTSLSWRGETALNGVTYMVESAQVTAETTR